MKRRNTAVDWRPAALASVVFTLITTTTPSLATTETSDACNLPTTYGAVTLPGVPSNSSWSGYARVSNTVSLFYHLSEATAHNGSNETAAPPPLIVWTNGGPGASSVLYGDWFQNVGAFHVTTSQGVSKAMINPDAIGAQFATLAIDHPAPTGLSVYCADGAKGGPPGTQEANAKDYVAALQIILGRHLSFRNRDIYIAGESYAGRYIPAIATACRSADPLGLGRSVKGLMIGNGEVDAAAAFASYGPFMFATGFLTESQRDILANTSARCTALVRAHAWSEATEVCYTIRAQVAEWTGPGAFFDDDIRAGTDPFTEEMAAVQAFLDRPDVREGLHAAPLSLKPSIAADGRKAWAAFNSTGDFVKSAVPLLPQLLGDNGTTTPVRILLYTGVFDEVMNVLSTNNWLQTLTWSGVDEFLAIDRTPYFLSNTTTPTVGYHRKHGTLSQLHVLRAGHYATKQQPLVLRDAFARFIRGEI